MSSIVKMYDASNNDVYPITHLRAVRDSNGTTLESMIQGVNETTVGYYECTTAGSTPEKTITIDSSVSLSVRISCKVKFAEKNTGANATMNINNTGAKPLFYNGVRASANNSWYTNEIVDLYFDGTNYQAKSCADTLEYDVSLHQNHEITEVTTTTRTVVYNGDVTSGWENETSVSDSSVNGYTRTETNTGKDNDTTTVDGPTAKYDTASNKTSVVYVTKRTLTHVVNDYTFDEAVNAVPMSYRHGGLKLRFISNNDGSGGKYVCYFLNKSDWSNSIVDWGKINLEDEVKELNKKVGGFSQKEVDEEGLYLCNEKGEVLLRLDILDTNNPIGDNMLSYIEKHIKKGIISQCIEDGFYICNEKGEVIAQYKNNEWQFIGIEIKKEVKINPCYSSLGLESGVIKADSLSNSELVLTDYPQYLKRNATVSFGATISAFSQVKVGVKGGYFCMAQIDSTNISIIHNTGTIKTEAHGLNISGWIDVVLKVEELNVEISIHSLDGYKKITATLPFRELYGRPTVEVDENTTLTDVSLRGYCDDFQKSIWFVGDSYTSCTEVRWTGQMLNFGIDNWMLLGLAGGKSKDLYEDLLLALKYGTPTYLVWCMGMNDADNGSLNTDYKKYFELVKAKCDELGIIMVPATVPCVKTSAHPTYARDNSYKNAFIKTSGMRYIDLAKAVGGDTFTEDAWYDGYLENISPWIHTTELGAKAQAAQIIRDFPEILRNK